MPYGLISAWNLNEASGNALDSFGASPGVDTNTVTSGLGIGGVGVARSFDAASAEKFTVADNAALSTGDVDWWFSIWALITATTGERIIASKSKPATDDREWVLDHLNSSNRFNLIVSATGTSTITTLTANTFGAPAPGVWHHLFAYHDAVNNLLGLAVNGGAFDTIAHAGGLTDKAGAFAIGGYDGASVTWHGRLALAAFGKSPPDGIAAAAPGLRDYFHNSGHGMPYPWAEVPGTAVMAVEAVGSATMTIEFDNP